VKRSWEELGLKRVLDANGGEPQGIATVTDNLRDGRRQIGSDVYSLEGVTVLTEALVVSVVIEGDAKDKKAARVRLADGRVSTASEEVILSAGAIGSPQILLLSGIGARKIWRNMESSNWLILPKLGRISMAICVFLNGGNYSNQKRGLLSVHRISTINLSRKGSRETGASPKQCRMTG
jgi:choline dehydrogenase-like flavoprotein